MKATDPFKETIKSYLDSRASSDVLFAKTYTKDGKTIDDCVTYIMNQVKESGCNGFADDEIYCMAVHYYDEDKIEVGKPTSGRVIVNHIVELTEEEKFLAKQKAIDEIVAEERKRITSKSIKPAIKLKVQQASLF